MTVSILQVSNGLSGKLSDLHKTSGAGIQAWIYSILSVMSCCLLRHRTGSLMAFEDTIVAVRAQRDFPSGQTTATKCAYEWNQVSL